MLCVRCWTTSSRRNATRKLPSTASVLRSYRLGGALQIMLDKGKDLDWFNSSVILMLLIVTLIAFVDVDLGAHGRASDRRLELFRSRSFALGTVGLCLGYAVFFGNIVLMPLWLQSYVGYTATWAGLVSAQAVQARY